MVNKKTTTAYSFYKSILNEEELERDSAKDKQLDEIHVEIICLKDFVQS